MEIQPLLEDTHNIRITPDGRISRQDAAKYLGIAYVTLSQWEQACRYGLKPIKIGRRVFYSFDCIRLIAEGRIGEEGEAR